MHHCVWSLFTLLRFAGRSEVIPSLLTRRRMMFAVPPASVWSMRGRDFDHLPCGSHVRSFPESWPFFTVARETVRGFWRRGFFSRAWSNRRLAPSFQTTGPDDRHTLGHNASDRHHHHEKRFEWIIHGVAQTCTPCTCGFSWKVGGRAGGCQNGQLCLHCHVCPKRAARQRRKPRKFEHRVGAFHQQVPCETP